MICPKCQDLMRTIDRGGVHIEQCERCRGVFLDGGELEQILEAERRHYGDGPPPAHIPMPLPHENPDPTAVPPPPAPAYAPPTHSSQPAGVPPPYQPPPGTQQPGYPPPGYGYQQPGYYPPPRRRSFLEELLD